jgi:transcriptional regulator with XRE-family HTH domain
MVSCVKVERVQVVDSPGLGARIKAAREGSDRPLRVLANEAGMTAANWYRIENEEVKRLPEVTLRKIEAVLSIDLGVEFMHPLPPGDMAKQMIEVHGADYARAFTKELAAQVKAPEGDRND